MKTTKVKINGKVNLTLAVLGKENGYHNISSIVVSVSLADTIILLKRADKEVTLKEKGIVVGVGEENNAVKTAKKFMERYNTLGVDIIITKKIPVGGGLGGSSADIAGVLIGMSELYGVNEGVGELADELGSDARYMLNGGYAVITGRGEKIERLKIKTKFYLILLTENTIISAKDSYNKFDKTGGKTGGATGETLNYLLKGDKENFAKSMFNDLYKPSKALCPKLGKNIKILEGVGAEKVLMTGSGATTYALFFDKKSRDKAYKELIKVVDKKKLIKVETIN